jgi:uridine phosphorylase
MAEEKTLHLRIRSGDVEHIAIIPSSHEWVDYVCGFLSFAHPISQFREFKITNGKIGKIPVTVCSTGTGGQSTAIAIEELHKCGSGVFVRIGTSCPYPGKTSPGDLLLVQGASSTDGTVAHYLPQQYPLLADPSLLFALEDSCIRRQVRYTVGTAFCPAVWHRTGTSIGDACVDLNTAAVFAVCNALHTKAACLLEMLSPTQNVDVAEAPNAVAVLLEMIGEGGM